ncbi:unnamed protein product [Dracunculus medinensis]|uniref:Ribosome production factor 2 homolog n=1 Tax=Dracunculus medinensis TaxID=318479 RepID=A0A0N4UDX1_DRAME|nr:unnamed protein product [Dracunculus medinensis]
MVRHFFLTRRGKKFLMNREPKIIENDKMAFIIKGGKTNSIVSSALREFYLLKKPLVQQLKKKNPYHPFEDDTSIEKFSMKFDSSLFLFGSNSKKHPNSLIFGRMYDYHILDMVELRIEKFVPHAILGEKPCIILQGDSFESDPFRRIGNLMVDWLRGSVVNSIRLEGLETVISLTAIFDKILFRVYRICLKNSTSDVPRVELLESGPRIDFSVQRMKLASENLLKTALKQPKQLIAKPRKNLSNNVFGTKLARVHVGNQNIDALQTRKVKALKRNKEN